MSDLSATLSVRNLRTHFFTKEGVAKAVDGVDFDVAAGEILGLVGESGSGKTVTGFSMLGLIDPPGRIVEGSSIKFNGEELTSAAPERLRAIMRVLSAKKPQHGDSRSANHAMLVLGTKICRRMKGESQRSAEDLAGQGR